MEAHTILKVTGNPLKLTVSQLLSLSILNKTLKLAAALRIGSQEHNFEATVVENNDLSRT